MDPNAMANKILPPELWGGILQNLKGDGKSLLMSSRTCQTWNELLSKDKVIWLFPLVIPHVEKYLVGNDRLVCRQVSKGWKEGVDQMLELSVQAWSPHADEDLMYGVQLVEDEGHGSYRGRNVFCGTEDFERFSEEMKGNPGNPFPSKSVIYQSVPYPDIDGDRLLRDKERLGTWLTTFGTQILDFTYLAKNWLLYFPDHVETILEKLPNLQTFNLQYMNDYMRFDFVMKPVMPELRHLKSLTLDGDFYITLPPDDIFVLFHALLSKYGSQLEELDIGAYVFNNTPYFEEDLSKKGRLGSLKSLKIRNMWGGWCKLDAKLLNIGLPELQRTSLHFTGSYNENQMVELSDLISSLNRWSSKLTEAHLIAELSQLRIYSPLPYPGSEICQDLKKELPFLKVFGVCYSLINTPILSWILKKFPKLERLEFHSYGNNQAQGILHPEPEFNSDEEELDHITPSVSSPGLAVDFNHEEICRRVGWVWEEVPTLKEIIIWGRVMWGNPTRKVFSWKRGEQAK